MQEQLAEASPGTPGPAVLFVEPTPRNPAETPREYESPEPTPRPLAVPAPAAGSEDTVTTTDYIPYNPPTPSVTKKPGHWILRNKFKMAIMFTIVTIVIVIASIPADLFDFGKLESNQTFNFASLASDVNLNDFAGSIVTIASIPSKCLTRGSIRYQVPYNGSTLVTMITLYYSCKTYSSNEFRDRMYARLGAGKFAEYQIVGFGEGLQVPMNFCPPNRYGMYCKACSNCNNPLTCDAGTLGTGACRCSQSFIGPFSGFVQGQQLAQTGRCLMLSTSTVDFSSVNVGTTSSQILFVYNVGNKTSTLQNLYVEAISSEDGDSISDVSSFGINYMPSLPLILPPGSSFNVSVWLTPSRWGNLKAYLGIYLHDSDTIPPDDVIQAVDLSGVGTIGGIVPTGDSIVGTYSLYKTDCGSAVTVPWNGESWEVDSYFSGGREKTVGSGVLESYRLLDSNTESGFNGYRFPVKYAGNITVVLHFADYSSNDTNQRVFDIYISGKLAFEKFDIFEKTRGLGQPYSVQYELRSAPASKSLDIEFVPIVGRPLVNAIRVLQTLNVTLNATASGADINYAEALHKNYLFYEAQKSGPMRSSSRLAWRADSCADCKGVYGEDLSKGYYEAGNYLKLNFPMCWTLTSLAWGMSLSPSGHQKSGQSSNALSVLKWGTDYIQASHPTADQFVLSVGWAAADFLYWGPPEKYRDHVRRRDVFYINAGEGNRSSETLGECAAALASASIEFGKAGDQGYAASLLQTAEELFRMGINYPGSHMDSKNPGFVQLAQLYASFSYEDELAWGAAWLYAATKDLSYLNLARSYYDSYIQTAQCGWAYSWEEKGPGLSVLLSSIDPDNNRKAIYDKYSKCHLNMWLPGTSRTVPHTPRGLSFRLNWGACRFAANTAFLTFAYAESLKAGSTDADYQKSLYDYGKGQVDYMLGKYGRSYMAGFGLLYAKYIWHKSSYNSILYWPVQYNSSGFQSFEFKGSFRPQTHILYGALVGGPIAVNNVATDFFLDNRSSYVYTEVTIDYNAALAGAIAYLAEKEGGSTISDSELDLGNNFVRPTGYKYDYAGIIEATSAPTQSIVSTPLPEVSAVNP